jgi:YgiT-type zinc finger domain-containing protein
MADNFVRTKTTTCPTCGGKKIRLVTRDWISNARGQTYTVPGLTYYECPGCGEKIYDKEAMRRIEEKAATTRYAHKKKAA